MRNILRTVVTAMTLVAIVCSMSARQPAMSEKQQEQARKSIVKEARKQARQKEKEGWRVEQTGLMETVIAEHREKLTIRGLEERIGTADSFKSRSLARTQCLNNAVKEYATEVSGVIKGKMVSSDVSNDDAARQAENFKGDFEQRMAAELAGELRISYSLYRKNPDGTYDMEVYYVVDPEGAHSAKLRAAKYAAELAQLDAQWVEEITRSIDDND